MFFVLVLTQNMFSKNKTLLMLGFIATFVIFIELIIIYFPSVTNPLHQFVTDMQKISYRLKPSKLDESPNETNAERREFRSAVSTDKWLIFYSKEMRYSFNYPPEFSVQNRGKTPQGRTVIALLHAQANKKITVATFSFGEKDSELKRVFIKKGTDGDLNRIAEYKYPFNDKSLDMLFTLYSRSGSNFSYDSVSNDINNSLKFYTF